MRILLVDDEAPARARMRRLLACVADAEIVGEAASGHEAVTAIAELRPDVVLLDIQMPVLDGFGVVEAVGADAMPPVVFVTAYDEHALRAFEAQALDYLMKPVRPERLATALERVRRMQAPASPPHDDGASAPLAERLESLLAALGRASRPLHHILVQHEGRALLVPVSRIVRIGASRNYIRIHVPGGEYSVRGTITALEPRLDPAVFLRINRGEIVRLEAIREMHPWSHGDYHVILHDGTRLIWSRRYRARSEHLLGFGPLPPSG